MPEDPTPEDPVPEKPVPERPAPDKPVPDKPAHKAAGRSKPSQATATRFTPTPPSGWQRARKAFTQRPDLGQVAVAVLVFLLGFAAVVQVRGDEADALSQARRDDLLQALDGLNLQGERLQEQVRQLESDRRDLVSGAGNEQAALEQATERLRQLQILAGIAPATGPGVQITILDPNGNVRAGDVLSAIHDQRAAGAEAIQIAGRGTPAVRVIANSYILPGDEGIVVDGHELTPPYTMTLIGDSASLAGAATFPRGLADDVLAVGGQAIVEESEQVTVDAVRDPTEPQYASPSPSPDDD